MTSTKSTSTLLTEPQRETGTTQMNAGIRFSKTFPFTFFVLILVIGSIQTGNSQTGWTVRASGTTQRLNFITKERVISGRQLILGDSGVILLRRSEHDLLTRIPSGVTTSLTAGTFPYTDTGYIVGKGGTFLSSYDSGKTWTGSPGAIGLTNFVTFDIPSPYLISGSKLGLVTGDNGIIFQTLDRGRTWVRVNSGTTQTIRRIAFGSSVLRAFACGDSGNVLKSNNAGSSWSRFPLSSALGSLNSFSILTIGSNDTMIVVGAHGTILKIAVSFGSTNYSYVKKSNPVLANLNDVSFFPNQRTGFAVGDSGTILITTDYGDTWVRQESGTSINLRSVIMNDRGSSVTIVGDSGLILETTTGGVFQPTLSPARSYPGSQFDFGSVTVGASKKLQLSIHNPFRSDLHIHASADNNAFTFFPSDLAIGAGGDAEVTLTATPGDSGQIVSNISILADATTTSYHASVTGIAPVSNVLTGEWVHTKPTPDRMWDLTIPADKSSWMVGENGAIMKSTDAGHSWKISYVMPTHNALYAVSFCDINQGMAVGAFGAVLKTSDGGITWKSLDGFTTIACNDLTYLNPGTAIVSGGIRTTTDLVAPNPYPGSGFISFTTDGGGSWLRSFSDNDVTIHKIVFEDNVNGFAAGACRMQIGTGNFGILLRTIDGGKHWTRTSYGLPDPIISIAFRDQLHGLAVSGGPEMLRTSDGGATWDTIAASPQIRFVNSDHSGAWFGQAGLAENAKHLILFRSTNDGESWNTILIGAVGENFVTLAAAQSGKCFALGTNFPYGNAAEIGSVLYQSTNNGADWTKESDSLYMGSLREVTFPSPKTGFACGDLGEVVKTSDGGTTWQRAFPLSIFDILSTRLVSVSAPDDSTAVVAGTTGELLQSKDGGSTWKYKSSDNHYVAAVRFRNFLNGVSIGAEVLTTTDGGNSWFRHGDFPNSAWTFRDVAWTTSSAFTAVGTELSGESMLHFGESGQTWDRQASGLSGPLQGVCFVDTMHGFAVGSSGTILRTTNGGDLWQRIESGTDEVLLKVHFADSQHGAILGALGTLLYTRDGGAHWNSSSVGTKLLTDFSFRDDSTLIGVGALGSVLKISLSRLTAVDENQHGTMPSQFALEQNYPNPFNPSTTIRFQLPVSGFATLKVYDILGRELTTLLNDRVDAGYKSVEWNAAGVPSGVYFYRLNVAGSGNMQYSQVRKMLVVK